MVTIDRVTSDAQFHWRVDKHPNVNVLFIELEHPLAAHAAVTFVVHESCADCFFAVDQEQVREISILGQIRAESSFSSHVDWHPIEEWNDAAVDITFDVPGRFVALTGGELVDDAANGERHLYHDSEARRTRRQLPFGFAVGESVSRSGKSDGGLRYSVWGFAGEEPLLEQRLPILGQAVAAYERALGPLAWNDVRFVHVRPERKEAGVSLPGMVLLSDGYFADVTGVDLSDGNIDSGRGLSVLVLAEGIAEFTDALFVENRHGAAAYRRAIHFNRDAWIVTAGAETEYAIANPAVSSNSRYRAVVFSKTPAVLHALRVQLGDDLFFKGMRGAFEIADTGVDGFARLEQGFSAAAGRDLHPFFEQWFFRAGFPTLRFEHAATNGGERLTLRQTQSEAPYTLSVPVQFECEDGSTRPFTVELREREQSFEIPLPSPAKSVTVDPDGTLPARVHP